MGLIKKIELENGIITNYHRINSINKVINQCTIIEVSSYTSKEKRKEEEQALKKGRETGEAVEMNVYINTTIYEKDYVSAETIEDIYNYVKQQDKFKDAEDDK